MWVDCHFAPNCHPFNQPLTVPFSHSHFHFAVSAHSLQTNSCGVCAASHLDVNCFAGVSNSAGSSPALCFRFTLEISWNRSGSRVKVEPRPGCPPKNIRHSFMYIHTATTPIQEHVLVFWARLENALFVDSRFFKGAGFPAFINFDRLSPVLYWSVIRPNFQGVLCLSVHIQETTFSRKWPEILERDEITLLITRE